MREQDKLIALQRERISTYEAELAAAKVALASGEGERTSLLAAISRLEAALKAEKDALEQSEKRSATLREELDETREKLDAANARATRNLLVGGVVGLLLGIGIGILANGDN